MTIPSIRNYENRPPAGGWNLTYEFRGQKFPLSGGWRQITQGIANIQKRNSAYRGMDEIFAYCNAIWCAKDPGRCMTPAEQTEAMKRSGRTCGRCGGRRVR